MAHIRETQVRAVERGKQERDWWGGAGGGAGTHASLCADASQNAHAPVLGLLLPITTVRVRRPASSAAMVCVWRRNASGGRGVKTKRQVRLGPHHSPPETNPPFSPGGRASAPPTPCVTVIQMDWHAPPPLGRRATLIPTVRALTSHPDASAALDLLHAAAWTVEPLQRARGWAVGELLEFAPRSAALLVRGRERQGGGKQVLVF